MKKKTTLLVATLTAMATLAVSATALVSSNATLSADATGAPLNMVVVKDTVNNTTPTTVKSAYGNLIPAKVEIGPRDEDPTRFAMRSFANTEAIGGISGFDIETDGAATINAYSYSYGYEKDADGNPIYVKEGLSFEAVNKFSLEFQYVAHLGRPNFIKLSHIENGWAPLKNLTIHYGEKLAGGGDAECVSTVTPEIFKSKVVLDYVDTAKTDVEFTYNTKGTHWRGDMADYDCVLTNPTAGTEFVIKANGTEITPTKLDANYLAITGNTIKVLKDVNGTIAFNVVLGEIADHVFAKIDDVAKEHTYRMIGINFADSRATGDQKGTWWNPALFPTNIAPVKNGTKLTWKSLGVQGQDNLDLSTNFQIKNELEAVTNALDSKQDPNIAKAVGANVIITTKGNATVDVTFDTVTLKILVTLVA